MELSTEGLATTRVVVPPFDEQGRIADFLDAETARIDSLLHFRREHLALLDERRTSGISELVTPGIASISQPSSLWPWLPASIAMGRLGYCARVQTGVTVHGARERTQDDAEYPYLRVANVQGGGIVSFLR